MATQEIQELVYTEELLKLAQDFKRNLATLSKINRQENLNNYCNRMEKLKNTPTFSLIIKFHDGTYIHVPSLEGRENMELIANYWYINNCGIKQISINIKAKPFFQMNFKGNETAKIPVRYPKMQIK